MKKYKLDWDRVRDENLIKKRGAEYPNIKKPLEIKCGDEIIYLEGEISNLYVTRKLAKEYNRSVKARKKKQITFDLTKRAFIDSLREFNFCGYCQAPIKTYRVSVLMEMKKKRRKSVGGYEFLENHWHNKKLVNDTNVGFIRPHFELASDPNTNKYFPVFVDGSGVFRQRRLDFMTNISVWLVYQAFLINPLVGRAMARLATRKIEKWFDIVGGRQIENRFYTPPPYYVKEGKCTCKKFA